GRKLAFRSYEYSLADCEHIVSGSEEKLAAYRPEEGWKNLLVDYVTNGENHAEYQGHDAIVNAHDYRAQALAEL
ncbi:MAG TPA: nicotinate phosphoribosyltransferase, partial [Bifidobacterium sp.]|nr:nicotinate phosphoribosyltransferase [Bifidobacterium sp.]